MKKKVIAAAAIAASALSVTLSAAAASPAADAPAVVKCHARVWHAPGNVSLRSFLAHHPVHGGLPGLLATSFECGGGWTPDWSAVLRQVNRPAGTATLLPRGMKVWWVGPGPRQRPAVAPCRKCP